MDASPYNTHSFHAAGRAASTWAGPTPAAVGAAQAPSLSAHAPAGGKQPRHAETRPLDAQLCAFARDGDGTAVMRMLAAGGVDLTAVDIGSGLTPLMLAAQQGHDDVVVLLTRSMQVQRQDPYQRSAQGDTALMLAAAAGQAETVELLLSEYAPQECKDEALGSAAAAGQKICIWRLIAHGARVNQPNRHGASPLQQAAAHGQLAAIGALLDTGAEVDQTDQAGWSALHTAGFSGHHAAVRLLLSYGANVNVAAANRDTPLIVAAGAGHLATVQALMDGGADLARRNGQGKTAADIAAHLGYRALSIALSGGIAPAANALHVASTESTTARKSNTGIDFGRDAPVPGTSRANPDKQVFPKSVKKDAPDRQVRDSGRTKPRYHASSTTTSTLPSCAGKMSSNAPRYRSNTVAASSSSTPRATPFGAGRPTQQHARSAGPKTTATDASTTSSTGIPRSLLPAAQSADSTASSSPAKLVDLVTRNDEKALRRALDEHRQPGRNVEDLLSHGDFLTVDDEATSLTVKLTPLMAAAYYGHAHLVKVLIDAGSLVNQLASDGRSALMFAAEKGHAAAVLALMKGGAAPDHQTLAGETALLLAAAYGHLAAVQALLQRDTMVDHADRSGWTVLSTATYHGHAEIVRTLLQSGAKPDLAHANGDTALMVAVDKGHVPAARALLLGGARVDHIRSSDGWTALMLAASVGDETVLQLLLAQAPKLDIATPDGWTALKVAAYHGHAGIVKFLLLAGASVDKTNGGGRFALIVGAEQGHADVVQALLNGGALVNHAMSSGHTALMFAAQSGHVAVARALINAGADADAAVEWAESAGNARAVQTLTQANASTAASRRTMPASEVVRPNRQIQLPAPPALFDAIVKNDLDALERMLAEATWSGRDLTPEFERASPLTTDRNFSAKQFRPLEAAAYFGRAAMTKALLAAGANVHAIAFDSNGWTALMFAISKDHTATVEVLLQYDADIEHYTWNDWTPLKLAASKGHADTVRLLLQYGANATLRDLNGDTALTLAQKNGHPAVAELLLNSH